MLISAKPNHNVANPTTTNISGSEASHTTAASSNADTTLTRKSYAPGERHPSSVRPKRDKSQKESPKFEPRLSPVNPLFAGPHCFPAHFAPCAATAAAPAAAASGSR